MALLTAVIATAPQVAAAAQGGPPGGERLLGAVERGAKGCSELSKGDFEAIGETLMGRMAGTPQAHQAMNRFMVAMMGARGEQQTHEYMGRRFSGCGGGTLPAGFGRMMGAIGAPGMMGGTRSGGGAGFDGAPGMMGGRAGPRAYPGPDPASMMGGYRRGARGPNDDGEGPSAAAMIGMMAVFIAAVGLVLLFLRPRARRSDPLEILRQRFARGELTAEEYRERTNLLGGGTTP